MISVQDEADQGQRHRLQPQRQRGLRGQLATAYVVSAEVAGGGGGGAQSRAHKKLPLGGH